MNPFQNPTEHVNIPPPMGGVPGVPPQYTAKYKWSAYRFTGAVAQGDYKVFVTTQGNAGQGFATGLTSRETSQQGQGAQISNQTNWLVWDLGVWFDLNNVVATPAILLDAQILQSAMTIILDYNETPYPLGPAVMYPAGGGIAGTPDSASTGTGAAWTNGQPSMMARRTQGDRPFVLQAGVQFDFNLKLSSATAGTVRTITTNADVVFYLGLWVWEDKAVTTGP